MTLPIKAEAQLMKHDEIDMLAPTHHPAILDADDKALGDIRVRIRDMLAKERGFVRSMRRSIRGKADARGGSFPGTVDKPARRKQVLASALKRLNKELSRRSAVEARETLKTSSRRALAMKSEAGGDTRPSGRSAGKGMRPIENTKRQTRANRAKVGSVSQQTKNAQAARDNRG